MKTNPSGVSAEARDESPRPAPRAMSASHDSYKLLVDAMRLIVEAPAYADAAQRVAGFMRSHCGLCLLVLEAQEGEGLRRDTYQGLPSADEEARVLAGNERRIVVPVPRAECGESITFSFAPDAMIPPHDVLQTLADGLALRLADDRLRRRVQDAEQTAAWGLRAVTAAEEIGQALAPASSQQTFQTIVERAARLMDAQTCSLLLLDEWGQSLHIAASYGLGQDTRAQKQLLGDSIAGRVAESKEPLLIGRTGPRDARLHGIKLKAELGSAMLTPLKDQENGVLGVLCVRRHDNKAEFTIEEAHLFSAFATQCGLLLHNARLTRDINRRAQRELQITALSRSLLSSLDLDAALHTALAEVCRIADCNRCCLYLREPTRPIFTPRHLLGYPEHVGRNPVKSGEGAVGLAARVRHTLRFDGGEDVTPDTAQTLAYRQMKGFARSLGVNAFVAVPLLTGAEACIGVLVADNKLQRRPITEEQLHLLESFAAQAGIALENARLSEQMRDSVASLRGLKDYTDNVLQSIEAAILTTDERGHVARCNRAAEETFQRPVRALRDMPLADALACLRLPPDEAEHLLALARHVQETGERVHRLKLTLHPQDRPPATVYLMVSRLPEHKSAREGGRSARAGVVIIFEDVTQEERLQTELEKMRRLADIGQLAAKMAHEVRNALTPIKSAAQLLRDDLACAHDHAAAPTDPAVESFPYQLPSTEWPDMIIAEVDGLSRLTNEMLDFARPVSFEPRLLSLNLFLQSSVHALASFLDEHRVHLQWRLDPLLPAIYADPAQMGQVVRNLVMNAAQAMPPDGTLTLHTALDETRGFVTLRFEDTGCGIPAENIERIFRPFVTTRPKGTGLGLSIVQKIVDQHGGRVDAQSQVGTGTSFTVRLPLTPAPSPLDDLRDEAGNRKRFSFEDVLNHVKDQGRVPDKQE